MCHVLFNLTSKISRAVLTKQYLTNLLECVKYRNEKYFHRMDLKCNLSLFNGVEDRYHGITVDSEDENCAVEELPTKIDESIRQWQKNSKRGIWFKVALKDAPWVPILANKGFNFHHANIGYVMMYRWLSTEDCNIPNYAHTILAVGAIVVNKNNEILAVQEKYFMTHHWKFPGGLVEPGEDLIKAAIREVKEETNIDCEFQSVIGFRHAHKGMFDCSDMYIVLSFTALSESINKCPREILACKWMDIQEFLNSNEVTEINKLCAQRYLEYKEKNIKIECKEGIHQILKKHYCIYTGVEDKVNCNSS